MTATYTNNPENSQLDAVRMLIGDTNAASARLSDEEIQYFINTAGNLYLAAAYAVEAIMSVEGGGVTSKQVGDLKITYGGSGGASGLAALAKTLRLRAARTSGNPFAGGISEGDRDTIESDTDRSKPAFTVGDTDNPGSEDGRVMSW